MSDEYNAQIIALTQWYLNRLKGMAPLCVSEEQYKIGLDAMPDEYHQLMSESFDLWFSQHEYELSYNQQNTAFFAAVKELGKLEFLPS